MSWSSAAQVVLHAECCFREEHAWRSLRQTMETVVGHGVQDGRRWATLPEHMDLFEADNHCDRTAEHKCAVLVRVMDLFNMFPPHWVGDFALRHAHPVQGAKADFCLRILARFCGTLPLWLPAHVALVLPLVHAALKDMSRQSLRNQAVVIVAAVMDQGLETDWVLRVLVPLVRLSTVLPCPHLGPQLQVLRWAGCWAPESLLPFAAQLTEVVNCTHEYMRDVVAVLSCLLACPQGAAVLQACGLAETVAIRLTRRNTWPTTWSDVQEQQNDNWRALMSLLKAWTQAGLAFDSVHPYQSVLCSRLVLLAYAEQQSDPALETFARAAMNGVLDVTLLPPDVMFQHLDSLYDWHRAPKRLAFYQHCDQVHRWSVLRRAWCAACTAISSR
jgi:hypothetical protein